MSHIGAAARRAAQLPRNELRLYDDKECTREASDIDFGRATLGQTYPVVKYLKNHSDRWPFVSIELNTKDPDITADLPQFLPPLTVQKITFKFTPSLARRETLDVQNLIKAEMFIG